jgi:ketosteroid isomerase-like protein
LLRNSKTAMETHTIENEAKELVLDLIHALNEEDFDSARSCITEDFTFVGVMGTRKGADSYIEDMKKIKIKYKIHKVLAEGGDVCVLCDYTMDGKTIFGCSWYELRDGQLSSLRSIFDPRPLLEKK